MPLKTKGKFSQYALAGSLLGLYNGFFYRPSGNTDIGIAVILALFASLATTIIRARRKKQPFVQALKDFFIVFFSYLLFMLSLALRGPALEAGGKGLVLAQCTLAGALAGLLLAWQWSLESSDGI